MGVSVILFVAIAIGVFFLTAILIALVVALKGKNRDD